MTSPSQEIKNRLDIVDFIRSYIPLLPAGKNFKANCPFHKEKTPSFIVSPDKQMWHCFGACNEGGDIFKFLMKYENLEFYEALKILAEKAGVELKKFSPAEHKQFGILYDINQSAKDFFKNQLEQSAETLNYLKERGLKKEIIEEFELGLAPSNYDDLIRHLIKSGYDIKDIERAGLNFKTERGSYVDRFRERIMFPLYNHFGKVVGFSGRILPRLELEKPELGKYVNSPETLIFNKSRILYGFHKTKNNIRKEESALLVEGQMDFLMLYQDGIQNAVATSGTALTADHLKTLRRLTDKLVLCFDNDEAGLNAAERAIDLAAVNDFNVKLLILRDFKDPAEAVQKSPGTLINLINETKPAMEFYFDRYLAAIDKGSILSTGKSVLPAGRQATRSGEFSDFKKKIRIVLGKIKNLASAVERAYWLKELALRTKIEERVLAEEMAALKSETTFSERNFQRVNPKSEIINQISRRDLIAQRLISLIIAKEELKSNIDNDCFDCLPVDYSVILKSLIEGVNLEQENLRELLNLISLRSSFESSILDEEKMEKEFQELIRQLHMEYFKEKRNNLIPLLKEAEANGDEIKVDQLLQEFSHLTQFTS